MVHSLKFIRPVLAFLAMLSPWTGAARAEPSVQLEHVNLSVSVEMPKKTGGPVWVAIRQDIASGWHTYWKNPGDSGLATSISWTLPKGVSSGEPLWPTPERFTTGSIVNFGYRDAPVLLVAITVASPNVPGMVKAKVSLLECQQMCIPESAIIDIDLRRTSGSPSDFVAARARIPKMFPGEAVISRNANSVSLSLKSPLLASIKRGAVEFYPETSNAIDYDSKPSLSQAGDTLTLVAKPAGYKRRFETFSGVLAVEGLGSFDIRAIEAPAIPPARAAALESGWLLALGLAFAGGLILNLMPCVLPILSMKALSIAGGTQPTMRRAAVAYFCGVVLTFLAVAVGFLSFRAFGLSLGWGFQLQSPPVVFVLMLLMSSIGLNLLGVFEVPASLMRIGNNRIGNGSFWTGVLAVVVASPCSAPFMATALGYALTAPVLTALGIFVALGIGFALPFSAIAFLPVLSKLIPRPGPWMVRFKELLAFPLFATAIWLSWILNLQLGPSRMMLAFFLVLVIIFTIWLIRHLEPRFRWVVGSLAFLATVFATAGLQAPAVPPARQIHWTEWSPEMVQQARRDGKPVFVDFSAAWCLTCLVNEQNALSDDEIAAQFEREHVVALRADWTNNNAVIAAELRSHARDGVPLYLIYPASEESGPVVLPQILTRTDILSALEKARHS